MSVLLFILAVLFGGAVIAFLVALVLALFLKWSGYLGEKK